MVLLVALLFFGATPALSEEEIQKKNQVLNLEFGLGAGVSHGSEGLPEAFTKRGIFSAIFSYRKPRWHIGITTRGAISTAAATVIQTSATRVTGTIPHRSIEYGLIGRRYVDDFWYGQVGVGLGYNEAIADERHLTPNPSPYFDRFYLVGSWWQAAIGREFKDSPWFTRLEYIYSRYSDSKVIQTDRGVNRRIEESSLTTHPHEHVFTFVVGLANLF